MGGGGGAGAEGQEKASAGCRQCYSACVPSCPAGELPVKAVCSSKTSNMGMMTYIACNLGKRVVAEGRGIAAWGMNICSVLPIQRRVIFPDSGFLKAGPDRGMQTPGTDTSNYSFLPILTRVSSETLIPLPTFSFPKSLFP